MRKFLPLVLFLFLILVFSASAQIAPNGSGIVYVKPIAAGSGNGTSWGNATADLQGAINAPGVTQVYVAIGVYPATSASFIMKNGVAIYGGFDPDGGVNIFLQNRILATKGMGDGSVLDGLGERPLIWNDNNGLNNTAILDGFTLTNGNGNFAGAIYNNGVAPVYNNLVIRNNEATTSGGGICNLNAPIKLSNSVIRNNTAPYGGGIRNNTSAAEFTNVSITNNTATLATTGAGGGGIFNESSALKLTNVLIANNSTSFSGGGFRNLSGTPVFTNVTLVNNTATQATTTAMEIVAGTPQINNSVIFGTTTGTYTPQYSLIEGNTSFTNGNINPAGIILTDIFTNPGNGSYTLKQGIVVNAGSNALNTTTTDLAGNTRIQVTTIDLGAYESGFTPIAPDANGIVYVKPTATGTGSGNSWTNASANLQGAINTTGVQKVYVAIGNYSATTASFIMKNNVAIYGGFNPANGITELTHPRALATKGMGDGSVLDGLNTRPLIWNDNNSLTNTAILDGFTLMNGKGASGGAMYNNAVAPVYNNLMIRNNEATTSAGGIYNNNAPIILSNSVIKNNTAPYGGGIRNNTNSHAEFTNVSITNNTATLGTTGAGGGGIFNQSSNIKLTNVLIANNSTAFSGGGFRNVSGTPVFTNVTLVNNTATGSTTTTAIEIAGGTPQINNSVIFGTTTGTYTPKYSLIEGNTNFTNGNIDPSGITVANIFTNNTTGDYTLKNSVAVNAGSNALNTTTTDLAGSVRIYNNGTIDLGAYESTYNSPIVPDANNIAYVKQTATGTGSGNSWANATADLQGAINATGVAKVYVAIGNYPVSATSSFNMKNNVAIYGGFDPENGKTELVDRILATKGMGDGSVLDGLNARPAIWNNNNGLTNTAILDGFTLMNGKSASAGAMYNNLVAPVYNNLMIRNNAATSSGGGGIYNNEAPIKLSNSVIKNNTAPYGGGVRNNANSHAEFANVSIINNTATDATSGTGGGGIFNQSSNIKLTNVLIANNSTSFSGGGFRNVSGTPVFTNVTLVNNTAANSATTTAMEIASETPQINNSVIYGTTTGTYTPRYSLIEGNTTFTNGNINPSGITLANIFNNNATGDYTLKNGVATNVGSNALNTSTTDLAGNARIQVTTIDLGAYESAFAPISPNANKTLYVNINVTGGSESGDSWANAIPQLADAMKYARAQYIANNAVYDATPLKIYVAKGTYKPLYSPANSDYTQDSGRDNAFVMVKNVQVYGGFDPAGNIDDLTDTRLLPSAGGDGGGSILSADIGNQNVANDNAHHLVISTGAVGTALLDGFTIRGAYTDYTVSSGDVTVNTYAVPRVNGAIYNAFSSPAYANCLITSNEKYYGAGMYNEAQSSPTLTNCSFVGNNAVSANGGAMYNNASSSPTISNCTFTNNKAINGGAMYNNTNSTPAISKSSFSGNTGSQYGGAMYNNNNNAPAISNSRFTSNTAKEGGAIYNNASSPLFINTLFANNMAVNNGNGSNGGSIRNEGASSPSLINVTMVSNGGVNAIYATAGGSTSIANSIVWEGISGVYTAQYSLIQGNTDLTNGNLSATGVNIYNYLNNDYTAKSISITIDKGSNALNTTATDLAGNARIYNNGIIDMGAFESTYDKTPITPDANNILYVNINVSGGDGTGNSWANAIPQLADAMKYARGEYIANNAVYDTTPLKIYVAKGTYKPMYSPNNYTYNEDAGISNAFVMVKNVQVYGGFDPSNAIYNLADRLLPSAEGDGGGSILSANIGTGYTHQIVISSGAVGAALLDGFTIRDAYTDYYSSPGSASVNGYGFTQSSGAIYNILSSPTYANCLITANLKWAAGGMYNAQASPTLINCSFVGNRTYYTDGGAIYNYYQSSPTITNCTFTNNGSRYGGAIYNSNNSSPIISNSSFIKNGGTEGGAIYNSASSPVIINTLFTNNSVSSVGNPSNGSAIHNVGTSSPSLTNVTIAGNTGLNAIYATAGGTTTVANSIVYGTISGTYTAQYSLIEGNTDFSNGNIDAAGVNINNVFTNPSTSDYTLKNDAAVNAGNNALNTSTTDLAGNSRIQFTTIDLGAYESALAPITPDANNIIYVNINGTGGNESGDSWANAIPQLGDAMRYARRQYIANNTVYDATPLKIYVAKGTYKPMYSAKNTAYNTNETRDNAFVMVKNVQIYGGFDPANNIYNLADRLLPSAGGDGGGSILSGDVNNTTQWIYDDAYHIVISAGAVGTALLDGFTIKDANMNYSGTNSVISVNTYPVYNANGAIYNFLSSPTYANCLITQNEKWSGAGMYNYGYASPTIINCSFINNAANFLDGAAINNNTFSSPIITNCSFIGNGASGYGGAIYNGNNSSPVISNSNFTNNGAKEGGAIYNNASSPVIINTLLANSQATLMYNPNNGGAIRNEGASSPSLTNVTIANSTGLNAIYATTGGTTTVANSIVFGTISGTYTAQYSLIEGNTDFSNGNTDAAGVNINNVFTNPSTSDYTLKSGSLAINKGSNVLNATTTDLAGNQRLYGTTIDLGAYEYQGTLPVTLVDFTAKADGNRAKLQWQTASELNNKGFEIYRSSDDGKFEKIGEVSATRNSQLATHNYSFTDYAPLNGNNYYQLVQVDNDGKATELGVKKVTFGFQPLALSLYPNPTVNTATVSFTAGTFNQLQVIDLNGRVLQQHQLNATASSKEIALGNYPVGVYLIKLNGTKTAIQKVVKK